MWPSILRARCFYWCSAAKRLLLLNLLIPALPSRLNQTDLRSGQNNQIHHGWVYIYHYAPECVSQMGYT
ncbi:hypothetical protein I7I53_04172 [Histoplasma capsulatum var. duboisii H88]|uniref:Secreted protein n=1 Tax=Ajellomyces capsulatus (strain H88) TaxID=544711 RepID=A0A8A1LSF1_AJEC8|nr:hypothetical protein I7I53_04172 [Histoplasma capsulatum var. duboisii H88]